MLGNVLGDVGIISTSHCISPRVAGLKRWSASGDCSMLLAIVTSGILRRVLLGRFGPSDVERSTCTHVSFLRSQYVAARPTGCRTPL